MIINGVEYVSGVYRGEGGEKMVTHLYKGTFSKPGHPMCSKGWQERYHNDEGKLIDWSYSIFRNNWTSKGLCKVCERRAKAGLLAVAVPYCKNGVAVNDVV